MSTVPHERFTLLSFDGFADDESSERSAEGLLRSTGAMHFRSAVRDRANLVPDSASRPPSIRDALKNLLPNTEIIERSALTM
jgi:hypothetical protein